MNALIRFCTRFGPLALVAVFLGACSTQPPPMVPSSISSRHNYVVAVRPTIEETSPTALLPSGNVGIFPNGIPPRLRDKTIVAQPRFSRGQQYSGNRSGLVLNGGETLHPKVLQDLLQKAEAQLPRYCGAQAASAQAAADAAVNAVILGMVGAVAGGHGTAVGAVVGGAGGFWAGYGQTTRNCQNAFDWYLELKLQESRTLNASGR